MSQNNDVKIISNVPATPTPRSILPKPSISMVVSCQRPNCDASFTADPAYANHFRSVHSEDPATSAPKTNCSVCIKYISLAMSAHIQKAHPAGVEQKKETPRVPTPPTKCPHCPFSLKDSPNYHDHARQKHNYADVAKADFVPPAGCQSCMRILYQNLEVHVKAVHPEFRKRNSSAPSRYAWLLKV